MKNVIIGLTGQTGAGKSTVSKAFEEKGFSVINADTVARTVVEKGKPCLDDIKKAFGYDIIQSDGSLDRKKLGNIVFNNRSELEKLNNITYPYIRKEISAIIKNYQDNNNNLILLDAPTLFESGTDAICDIIISVIADENIRINRIIKRDGITSEQAKSRINSQHSEKFFIENSDYYIENNNSTENALKSAYELADKIINL